MARRRGGQAPAVLGGLSAREVVGHQAVVDRAHRYPVRQEPRRLNGPRIDQAAHGLRGGVGGQHRRRHLLGCRQAPIYSTGLPVPPGANWGVSLLRNLHLPPRLLGGARAGGRPSTRSCPCARRGDDDDARARQAVVRPAEGCAPRGARWSALCGAMRVVYTGVARVGMAAVGRVVQNASGFRRVWVAHRRGDPKSV